jgi:hypothetical protein
MHSPILKAGAVAAPTIMEEIAPPFFKPHPLRFWSYLMIAFSAASFAIASSMKEPRPYLGMCLPEAVGLFLIPWAFSFTRDRFVIWAGSTKTFVDSRGSLHETVPDVEKWVLTELSFFNKSPGMYCSGAALAAWTLLAFYLGDYYTSFSWWENGFLWFLTALSACLAGFGLYAIFGATRMMWRFGVFPIIVKSHKFGVLSTGRILLQCYFAIAFVAAVYYATAVLGEKNLLTQFKYSNPCLLMLVLPTAAFVILSFVSSQFPLHWSMVEYKQTQLTQLDSALDALHRKVLDSEDTPHDLMEKISIVEGRRTEILSLPEWPFGFRGMLGAVGSSITVLLPTLISLTLKLIRSANADVLQF